MVVTVTEGRYGPEQQAQTEAFLAEAFLNAAEAARTAVKLERPWSALQLMPRSLPHPASALLRSSSPPVPGWPR
jgi:hypothetical protein